MDLTASLIEEKAREYERLEPLFGVEQDNIETFSTAFRDNEFTWKDAEWLVWWYYRRFLGAFPHVKRRAIEKSYKQNEFETVQEVVEAMFRADESAERIRLLTTLDGVSVPIASAFLAYLYPERYVVVGEREWRVLTEAGELVGEYPDPLSVTEYETYLETCRDLTNRFDVEPWTLYRGLWRLATE